VDSDIILGAEEVQVTGNAVNISATDLKLDNAGRRDPANSTPARRALVHDFGDGLTLNYNHDYPGGVKIFGPLTIQQFEVTVDVAQALQEAASAAQAVQQLQTQMQTISTVQEQLKNQVETLSASLTQHDTRLSELTREILQLGQRMGTPGGQA
jgi:hypothetical protein